MKTVLSKRYITKKRIILSNIVLLICFWTTHCHATYDQFTVPKMSAKKAGKQPQKKDLYLASLKPDLAHFLGKILDMDKANRLFQQAREKRKRKKTNTPQGAQKA